MKNGFEERAYDATCMVMGAAIWQLLATGEQLTPDAIARVILALSERHDDIAISIALSVLHQA